MAMVTPEMLQNVRNNLLKRARLCIQAGGSRFEHLL
jgi:predicted kinase